MTKIQELLNESLESGVLLREKHDFILKSIHKDGQIDEQEKQILSRLFTAIQSGEIKLVDEETVKIPRSSKQSKFLEKEKQKAIARDSKRDFETPVPQPQESKSVDLNCDDEDSDFEVDSERQPQNFEELSPKTHSQPETTDNQTYSLENFFGTAQERRNTGSPFVLRNDRLLDINVNGKVWMKTGAMIAYYGVLKFTREGFFEHGVKKLVKKGVTGEGTMLTKATGQGNLFLADQGKKISLMKLGGHSLVVNGTNLLAFEECVDWDITFLRQFAAIWKGGIFNVRLSGNGMAAISTVGDPVMLRVSPTDPIMTDMNATVAWSGSLAPQFKTDVAARTFIGRASGETIQMRFEGDGFVIIQPYEELTLEDQE